MGVTGTMASDEGPWRAGETGRRSLGRAAAAWVDRGEPEALLAWLARELDPEGVPIRLAVPTWSEALATVAGAVARRPEGWPEAIDARVEGLLRAALRFGRPDGSMGLAATGPDPSRWPSLRGLAARLSDPSLATVVRRWSPGKGAVSPWEEAPPPLPAHACPDRALAILRADWSARGDWLAIDHRGPAGLMELAGLGRPWLGPRWRSSPVEGAEGPGRPTFWKSGIHADAAEWSFRTPTGRVTRLAVLFRSRGLALLADQVEGPDPVATMRIDLAEGVEAAAVPGAPRGTLALSAGRGRSARVLPIGLPEDAGTLDVEGRAIVVRREATGGRTWLPLLVSWRPDRDRRPARWRLLTVSERSAACPPGVAFAARVAWGAGESLAIYRSLAAPDLRCFLGHQTRVRSLVGIFSKAGDVNPLLKIEA